MNEERLAEIKERLNEAEESPFDFTVVDKSQQDVPELVAEVERLQNKLALYALGKRNLDAMVEHKDTEIARLRKALEEITRLGPIDISDCARRYAEEALRNGD